MFGSGQLHRRGANRARYRVVAPVAACPSPLHPILDARGNGRRATRRNACTSHFRPISSCSPTPRKERCSFEKRSTQRPPRVHARRGREAQPAQRRAVGSSSIWGRWPELRGYLVQAATLRPFCDPRTGEGLWTHPVIKTRMLVRTEHAWSKSGRTTITLPGSSRPTRARRSSPSPSAVTDSRSRWDRLTRPRRARS